MGRRKEREQVQMKKTLKGSGRQKAKVPKWRGSSKG